MGKGIMETWDGASAEILELHHFYRKSSEAEFNRLIKDAADPLELTKNDFAHASFLGEAAGFILREFLSRRVNSANDGVRYWAASELCKHQRLEFKFFRVFN